jgi:hypothetical protein
MSETKVVNLRKAPYDVYIGRAGRGQDGYFGNPYALGKDGDRDEVLVKYKKYFQNRLDKDPEFFKRVAALAGKTLGCFCKPFACHGDIIVKYLGGRNEEPFWRRNLS